MPPLSVSARLSSDQHNTLKRPDNNQEETASLDADGGTLPGVSKHCEGRQVATLDLGQVTTNAAKKTTGPAPSRAARVFNCVMEFFAKLRRSLGRPKALNAETVEHIPPAKLLQLGGSEYNGLLQTIHVADALFSSTKNGVEKRTNGLKRNQAINSIFQMLNKRSETEGIAPSEFCESVDTEVDKIKEELSRTSGLGDIYLESKGQKLKEIYASKYFAQKIGEVKGEKLTEVIDEMLNFSQKHNVTLDKEIISPALQKAFSERKKIVDALPTTAQSLNKYQETIQRILSPITGETEETNPQILINKNQKEIDTIKENLRKRSEQFYTTGKTTSTAKSQNDSDMKSIGQLEKENKGAQAKLDNAVKSIRKAEETLLSALSSTHSNATSPLDDMLKLSRLANYLGDTLEELPRKDLLNSKSEFGPSALEAMIDTQMGLVEKVRTQPGNDFFLTRALNTDSVVRKRASEKTPQPQLTSFQALKEYFTEKTREKETADTSYHREISERHSQEGRIDRAEVGRFLIARNAKTQASLQEVLRQTYLEAAAAVSRASESFPLSLQEEREAKAQRDQTRKTTKGLAGKLSKGAHRRAAHEMLLESNRKEQTRETTKSLAGKLSKGAHQRAAQEMLLESNRKEQAIEAIRRLAGALSTLSRKANRQANQQAAQLGLREQTREATRSLARAPSEGADRRAAKGESLSGSESGGEVSSISTISLNQGELSTSSGGSSSESGEVSPNPNSTPPPEKSLTGRKRNALTVEIQQDRGFTREIEPLGEEYWTAGEDSPGNEPGGRKAHAATQTVET